MRDLGKLTLAKGFKNLLKVQKIAQSGHTATVMVIHLASFVELSHGQRTYIKNVKIFGHSWAALHHDTQRRTKNFCQILAKKINLQIGDFLGKIFHILLQLWPTIWHHQ